MVVVDDGTLAHESIANLPSFVPEGALVVLNDTRVVKARLLGNKVGSGGKAEIFLVRRTETTPRATGLAQTWRALGKSSKPLRPGAEIQAGPVHVRLLGRTDDGLLEVEVSTTNGTDVDAAIAEHGHMPLPPYIKRSDEPLDEQRYQTVFAKVDGAVAAPTAGLHLTEALLARLRERGCEITTITLHVGLGTFQPVVAEDLDDHVMHGEAFEVGRGAAAAVARARERGAPVFAVGTTAVRALESAADPTREGFVTPSAGETRLLIQPGYRFRVVDLLLTNFHLPRSTLLALVSAFAGTERVLAAYRAAVAERYRFFSYGDAMLLRRREP